MTRADNAFQILPVGDGDFKCILLWRLVGILLATDLSTSIFHSLHFVALSPLKIAPGR